MRRVLALLLAVNLLFGLWLGLRPAALPVDSVDSLAAVDGLELVSGLSSQVQQSRERCIEVGPFANADPVQDLPALDESIWAVRAVATNEQSLYRVFLGPAADRAAALALLGEVRQRLQVANLDIDSYVVTEGVLVNAVSLGLFSNVENAERVREQMLQLDYDAQLEPEIRRSETLWLSARLRDIPAGQLDSWRSILAADSAVSISENLCETIAHRK